MTFKLSRQQQLVLETVRKYGETGATIYDLEAALGLTKATLYKHLEKPVEVKAISKVYRVGDKKAYYIAGDGASMHVLPPLGEVIGAMPVASYLSQWEKADRVEDWSYWSKHFRKWPWLISTLSQFAWRFKADDDNYRPTAKEIEEVRLAITQIMQRADHLSLMCKGVLANESLWDRKKAFALWYEDQSVPFTPEIAKRIHAKLTETLEKSIRNAQEQ